LQKTTNNNQASLTAEELAELEVTSLLKKPSDKVSYALDFMYYFTNDASVFVCLSRPKLSI
jgi:hypothetical protein